MNVKNKAVILTMSVAVAFAMTACGSKQTADTASAVNSSSETNETVVASDTTNDNSASEDINTNVDDNSDADATSAVSSDKNETSTPASENSKILIAYFSVMETDGVDTVASASRVAVDGGTVGNNQYLASLIQQETGGDLFAIETVQDYPTTHDPLLEFAYNEKMEDARPELATHIDNLDQYDVIFLGYPNWNADLPMPLYTFLEEYDFSGKTIIPFTSHGGSGFSGTIQTIESLQPNATVLGDGLSVSRNSVAEAKDQVVNWVQGLGVNSENN